MRQDSFQREILKQEDTQGATALLNSGPNSKVLLEDPLLLREVDIVRSTLSLEISLELRYWGRNHKGVVS